MIQERGIPNRIIHYKSVMYIIIRESNYPPIGNPYVPTSILNTVHIEWTNTSIEWINPSIIIFFK